MARSDADAAHLEVNGQPAQPAHAELGALSDESLIKQTLPLATGARMKLIAAALLASIFSALAFDARSGLVVLAVGLLLVWVSQRLRAGSAHLQRARAAAHEFGRRFGAEPLARSLPEARAHIARNSDIEILGLFRGVVLPHGGLRFLRVELGAQPKLRVRSSPALSELQRGTRSTLELMDRELPLSAAQVERLRALVRELAEHPPVQLASFVQHGFPCEASVLARSETGLVELHASANISGLPDQLAQHPSVRLLELFLDFEAELVADGRLD
jgi:hypothetical protein